jgi:O-glycosyl hydrolase
MFWNFVLRSDGTPSPVSHANACYGVLDMDYVDGEYVYSKSSAYYAMAHVSKFAYPINGVEAKALRVESSNDAMIIACALYRADGAIVVTVCNISDVLSENVDIVIGGKSITYNVQPQSIVTFVC